MEKGGIFAEDKATKPVFFLPPSDRIPLDVFHALDLRSIRKLQTDFFNHSNFKTSKYIVQKRTCFPPEFSRQKPDTSCWYLNHRNSTSQNLILPVIGMQIMGCNQMSPWGDANHSKSSRLPFSVAKPEIYRNWLLQENLSYQKVGVGFGFFLRKVEGTTTATGATDVSQRKGREGISGLNFLWDSRLAEDSLQNSRKISVSALYILG